MKTLLLLRHAKSSWDDPALDDHDRPLNQRGYLEAPYVGDFLKAQDWIPDLIISSTALRARHTAELVARACGYSDKLVLEHGLYGASAQFFSQLIKPLPSNLNYVLLVGHNPDIEELILALCAEHVNISTATLAKIDLPIDLWSDYAKVGGRDKKAALAGIWQGKRLAVSSP